MTYNTVKVLGIPITPVHSKISFMDDLLFRKELPDLSDSFVIVLQFHDKRRTNEI